MVGLIVCVCVRMYAHVRTYVRTHVRMPMFARVCACVRARVGALACVPRQCAYARARV